MNGSSVLTAEQQEWFRDRYGLNYVAVQEQHIRPSRRVRRAMRFGGNHRLAVHDETVLRAQVEAMKVLEGTRITKAVKPDEQRPG